MKKLLALLLALILVSGWLLPQWQTMWSRSNSGAAGKTPGVVLWKNWYISLKLITPV